MQKKMLVTRIDQTVFNDSKGEAGRRGITFQEFIERALKQACLSKALKAAK